MPESHADYYDRISEHLDGEGRLGLPEGGIPYWDVFPFESEGLRLKAIEPPLDHEPDRRGEVPADCDCTDPVKAAKDMVWEDENWRLKAFQPSGAPVVLFLEPKQHFDLATLPPALAGEMGRLMARMTASVEALPSVARCHMSRWGDGGAHAHFFFIARPARMSQLRGTCMALWDDFLPPVPQEVFDANVAFVVDRLGSEPAVPVAHA